MYFEQSVIKKIKEKINNSKNAVIITHKNADGDTIGSCLALNFYLKKMGLNVQTISPDAIPDFYNWIEDIDQIMVYEQQKNKVEHIIKDSDIIFMLDYSDLKRIGKLEPIVGQSNNIKIVIDHHPNSSKIADYMFVDSTYSSAAELLYDFLKNINKDIIDKKIAEYIFLGIASDTGSFRFDSAGYATFEKAAELLKYNVDKEKIMNGLFNNYTFDRLKLLGNMLSNNTVFLKDKHLTYMSISLEDKKKYNYKKGYHEFFVNWGLSIEDSYLAVLFVETEEKVRISLRSKGKKINVSKIAKTYYSGGGHFNASGGDSYKSLDETIKEFVKNIDEILKFSMEN